jgi:hypothetical protein
MTRLFAVLSLLLSGGANAIGGYGGGNCEAADARLEALEAAVAKISDHLMPTGSTTVVVEGQHGTWIRPTNTAASFEATVDDTFPHVTDVKVDLKIFPPSESGANPIAYMLHEVVLRSPAGVSVVLYQDNPTPAMIGSFGTKDLGSLPAVGNMNDFLVDKGKGTRRLDITGKDCSYCPPLEEDATGTVEKFSVRLTCAMKVDDIPATTSFAVLEASISEIKASISEVVATVDDTNIRSMLLPNVDNNYYPNRRQGADPRNAPGLNKGYGMCEFIPSVLNEGESNQGVSKIEFLPTGSCFPFPPSYAYALANLCKSFDQGGVPDCKWVACGDYCKGGECPGTIRAAIGVSGSPDVGNGLPGRDACVAKDFFGKETGKCEMYYKKCTYDTPPTWSLGTI